MGTKKGSSEIPYVPANRSLPEITVASVSLGILLAVVLGAANTYLGLYAGMTVSASIPAAVMSMAILRGLLRRGNILENNIVQTVASSAESLAAGVIFTVPALLLTGVWTEVKFWPTTLIAITGGLLGILFMIPLRKSHVVEDETLSYPEGVACAEVLKTGEKKGSGAKYLFASVLVGGVLKFLTGGTNLIKGAIEWAWPMGRSGFYFGSDVSAALLGVGYIIGFNVATLVFLGGAIAWCIAIPYVGTQTGVEGNLMEWFWTMWSTKIRYMGVGAMIVGGLWSIISIWRGMVKGFKEAFSGYREAGSEKKKAGAVPRTEQNMKHSHMLVLLGLTMVAVFGLYQYLLNNVSIAIVSTIAMVVMSFFFVAVASYIVGLVGSSSSPVSGMTICAVLGTGGVLLLLGYTGVEGIIATLGVAGVVCCATCSAGDISQDLKTGYILGNTPRNQQWMEVVGAIIPSLIIAPVLIVLQHSYGIGTGEPGALKAPQATLFANIAQALFGEGNLPWGYVKAGATVGVIIVVLDQVLKAMKSSFRLPVMAVAVGIYLPLTLSVPIFLGGLVAALTRGDRGETDAGTLFASGLIAGEAIMGVALGVVIYFSKDALPIAISGEIFSALVFVGLAILLWAISNRRSKEA